MIFLILRLKLNIIDTVVKASFLDNDIYVVWLASIVFINNAMLKISFCYKSFHNEPDFNAKINGCKANRPLQINLFTKYL